MQWDYLDHLRSTLWGSIENNVLALYNFTRIVFLTLILDLSCPAHKAYLVLSLPFVRIDVYKISFYLISNYLLSRSLPESRDSDVPVLCYLPTLKERTGNASCPDHLEC